MASKTILHAFLAALLLPPAAHASFNIMDFGADNACRKDNHDAFDRLFKALKAEGGQQHVYIPAGCYLYVPRGSGSNSADTFSQEASDFVMEGDGDRSIIQIGGTKNVGARFGLPYVQQSTWSGAYPKPPWKVPPVADFDPARAGVSTIRLAHREDAAKFSAGATVYLQSGDAAPATGHSPYAYEWNEVASVDAQRGTLNLRQPLQDSYDALDPGYGPRIGRVDTVPHDIVIRNMAWVRPAGNPYNLLAFHARHVRVENCLLVGTVYTEFSQDVQIIGCRLESSDPRGVGGLRAANSFDSGDAGFDIVLKNNTIRNQGVYGFIASGSVKDYVIDGNTFESYSLSTSASYGISIGGRSARRKARNLVVTNNRILYDSRSHGPGIYVQYADGFEITNNTISGESSLAGVGIEIGGSCTNGKVTGNTVDLKGPNTVAIRFQPFRDDDVIEHVTVESNNLRATGQGIFLAGMTGSARGVSRNNVIRANEIHDAARSIVVAPESRNNNTIEPQ